MRIEQLAAVAAVTRLGSMRAAGKELHISQPALSETVRNLERELGITLLERHRSGARVSAAGRELLPYITEILEAVQRLRVAAGHQRRAARSVRIGTVHAATVALLTPAIRQLREEHPDSHVEVVNTQQADIHRALLGGSLDIGLVNLMEGDDVAPDLETVELVRGRAVVCCRADSPLAELPVVEPERLFAEPFIAMRSGYVMHRYVHRLLRGRDLAFACLADGAEMGKLMVAQGLGVTVLPDYSILGDPLERSGAITLRELATDDAVVILVAHCRAGHAPVAVRQLLAALLAQARRHQVEYPGHWTTGGSGG